MSWYFVVKTVKGRQYRYRQRSFRVGGSVRTESQFLGPVDAESAVTTLESSKEKPVITTTIDEPKLQTLSEIDDRKDISVRALETEDDFVRERMAAHGLSVSNLRPLRVAESDAVSRYKDKKHFYVTATAHGNRNLFKREYRRALADRWLLQVQQDDPVLFNDLRCSLDEKQKEARAALTQIILLSGTAHKFRAYLWFAWSGRLPQDLRKKIKPEKICLVDHEGGGWRDEAVKITGELIQHGTDKVFRKYGRATDIASATADVEIKRLKKMGWRGYLNGSARKQQKRVDKAIMWFNACHAAEQKAEVIASWYQHGEV